MAFDPHSLFSNNKILNGLPPDALKRLAPGLERLALDSSETLFHPGESVRYVYFPEEAVISMVANMADGKSVEVRLTGAEGVAGIGALFGAKAHWYTAIVQIRGSCRRMEAERFNAEFRRGGAMQARTLAYIRYALVQIAQNAACNRVHRVKQRLARHLLMLQDRVQENEFPTTHESLSYSLGTPRSEISVAAESLRKAGIIGYARGKVSILRRERLVSAACECYEIIHREFLSLG
jgi:CRP-like cAMP-binding protein